MAARRRSGAGALKTKNSTGGETMENGAFKRLASLAAALAFAVSAAGGCGGSGGQIQKTVAITQQEAAIVPSRTTILAGETVDINAQLNIIAGQTQVEVTPDPGGMLTQISAKQYSYSTLIPGEHTITARFTDSRGTTTTKTTTIVCMGRTADEGGVTGALYVNIPSARAAAAGPTTSGNILPAPVTIQPKPTLDPSRRVMYGRKAHDITPCAGDEFVPGELIVKLKPGGLPMNFAAANGQQVKSSSANTALMSMDTSGLSNAAALQKTRESCLALNNNPDVEYADLNHIQHTLAVPNDPYYPGQWSYSLINLPAAWNIVTGSSSVIVGVLDTGIVAAHADIKDKLTAGYDFVSSSSYGCDGDGFDSDPEDVADSRCQPYARDYSATGYHGTHTAGTIGASTNNGIGVSGVDWAAKIMPLRALSYRGGTDYDILTALKYAGGISNATGKTPAVNAKIINMSIGSDPGPSCYPGYNDIFDQLHAKGIIVFVSSGNDGSTTGINPIALCNHAVAVGAVDPYGKVSSYSNAGTGLDITAPGGAGSSENADSVLSTVRSDESDSDTYYDFMSGTSMAAPHASGLAALMVAAYPSITPDQIAQIMSQTAIDLGASGYDTTYGAGLINAYAAVLEAKKLGSSVSTPSQPVISVSPTILHFPSSESEKTAVITNTGSSGLTISSITDSEQSGGNWLSASVTNYTNNMLLTITVNRSGLSGGTYYGEIKITSNGGTSTIKVSAEASAPPPTPPAGCINPAVYLFAYDPSTYDIPGFKELNLAGGRFSFYGIPSGYYNVLAATDCDDNGYLCDQDIDLCGAYPEYRSRQSVRINGMQISSDVNFSLVSASTLNAPPAAGAPQYFQKDSVLASRIRQRIAGVKAAKK